MTDEELIARLRAYAQIEHAAASWGFAGEGEVLSIAADKIEALVNVRREDALDLLAASGQAQEAYEAQLKAEARAERLEAALREILEKPRNADLTYAELFAEVVSEARAALKGAADDRAVGGAE